MKSDTDRPLAGLLPSAGAPVTADDLLSRFLTYIQRQGLTLYPAQEEAILALFEGQNVILNTPTGSGKSLVALALHFHSAAHGRRSVYTCPIKALVNEKFLALCRDFGPDMVGMVTGDAAVNAGAQIICCTAEILANQALREGAGVGFDDVVMDEFHYYSDRERGVAWQVPLLTMARARFMLMSATLGDMGRFESGLSALTGKPTVTVRSTERPVPLTFVYQETPLHETVQHLVGNGKAPVYLVSFTQRECAEEAQNLMSVDLCGREEKQAISAELNAIGIRFSSPYGRDIQRLLKHGVGIHHAGLLPKYRLMVEKLAQKGLLKVICGTDTLGVGVNIPIRTVLFTKLCKYDGEKTALLSVRDFKQIAGRAGRKGFDVEGLVVVQAPEHVIENLRLEAKAAGDPKKQRKIVRKKPPEKGFINWNRETFDKLINGDPEPLMSRFAVSHGMLLNVLSRPGDGCQDMRRLIRASHETPVVKERLGRLAFTMFRSLVDRKIIEFTEPMPGRRKRGLRINVDLQEDFSIHHALALWLIDTVKLCDPYLETYALDILTCAESIIENPELILRRQLDRIKGDKVAELKAQGVEYEERMAELEKLEYPKPNRDFIYQTFNDFAAAHPWIGQDNIRPKSIAREMYENWMTFPEYVREYGLERTEGLLLRYLSEVYRVLMQSVPVTAKDEEFQQIVDYFGVMIRQVDSTLLDEWERLKRPDWRPAATEAGPAAVGEYDITRNPRELAAAVRSEVFQFVKALAGRRLEWVVDTLRESDPQCGWTVERLRAELAAYHAEHAGPLTDTRARGKGLVRLGEPAGNPAVMTVEQTLIDSDGHDDWQLTLEVHLEATRETGRVVFRDFRLGPIGQALK